MKKLILLIVLLLSFASVAFSYEEVEATDFIKEEIKKEQTKKKPYDSYFSLTDYDDLPEIPKFELKYVFSAGKDRFLVLAKEKYFEGSSLEVFYSDGVTFLSPLSIYFHYYDDSWRKEKGYSRFYYREPPNIIRQLEKKKCGELAFYVVDLNFDGESDYVWFYESGMGNGIKLGPFTESYKDSYFCSDSYAHIQDVNIEFCILEGKRGFIFTNTFGNFLTVWPDTSDYDSSKIEKEFYEYNPSTNKYELNENVTEKQIANAIIPDDYFAYDGLDFSKLNFRLIDDDLKNFDKAQLRLMRNAVYARHGRTFRSEDLQSLFNVYAWYKPDNEYTDDKLTDIDRANIKLIQEFEQK